MIIARRVGSIVLAIAVAVVSLYALIVGPASQAKADVTTTGYYKTQYSPTIYRYFNFGSSGAGHYPLNYADWQAAGSPTPQVVESSVVKYAWSPTLYAVTFFHGDWLWERLTPSSWAATGYKTPYDAGWIEGSSVTQYGSGPDLFLTGEDGSFHKLTYPEWVATGYVPQDGWNLDVGFVQFRGSPVIYYVYNYGTNREVGYGIDHARWVRYGSPTPARR